MSTATAIGGGGNSIPLSGNSGVVYNTVGHGHGTISANSNTGAIYNSTIASNGTISFPNSGGIWSNGTWISDTYQPDYDFSTKVLDIEKLFKMEPEKREMLLNLFLNFMNNDNHSSKTIMYNTLESYGLIIEQKALDRKIKIDNITKSEKKGTK